MTDIEIDRAISNWHKLNKNLKNFSEDECKRALVRELMGNKREDILMRIHARYSVMRKEREWAEIATQIGLPPMMVTVPELS